VCSTGVSYPVEATHLAAQHSSSLLLQCNANLSDYFCVVVSRDGVAVCRTVTQFNSFRIPKYGCRTELTMGHGSNGSTNLGGSRGSRVSTRDPLTHFILYTYGIPRDFLVHGKPITAIETVILTVN